MTLVNDDQIEEVGGELGVDVLFFFRPRDRLIEAQIDLVGLVDLSVRDLGHRLAERLEVVGLGLVREDVAVNEKQDSLLRAGLPQSPNDLEGGVGLARPRSHHKEQPVIAPCDCLYCLVDSRDLVVPGGLPRTVVVVVLSGNRLLLVREPLGLAVACPELGRCGELVQRDLALHHAALAGPVVLEERIAVRAVDERHIQDAGVFERLLHASTYRMGVVLGLHHGEREVRLVVEDVVGLLGLAAFDGLATDDDAALGEVDLFSDLGHQVPAGARLTHDGGGDELGADVGLGQRLLVGWVHSECSHRLAIAQSTDPYIQNQMVGDLNVLA